MCSTLSLFLSARTNHVYIYLFTGIYTYDALQDQEFKEDRKHQRPSLNAFVEVGTSTKNNRPRLESNPDLLGVSSTKNNRPRLESNPDLGGSGTSTPARRPSTSLLPGMSMSLDRPAVFLTPEDHSADVFEQDYDMLTLRRHATDPEFLSIFKEGVALYLAGDWPAARVMLTKADDYMRECAPVLGGDGPSLTLLEYMGNQNFEAPKNWAGFRPLTAK